MEKISRRFYEVDLLRFIAALAVVLFHYGFYGYAEGKMRLPYFTLAPLAKYGYLGVDLFFLISGFVILMTAFRCSAKRFVISRVVRLYPAFWACCTLTFLVTLLAAGRETASFKNYALNMTMLSGFFRTPAIDGSYWSLFVEIRFYVLVFVALLLGQLDRVKALLGLWLFLALVFSRWDVQYVSYFLISDYAHYFIGGAMLYLIHEEGVCPYKLAIVVSSYLAAVLAAAKVATESALHLGTPFSLVVVAAVIAVFYIVLFLVAIGRTSHIASARWLMLGALTYPLYLIHQYVGYLIFNALYGLVNDHALMCGTLAFVLAIAWAVHENVEKRYSRSFNSLLERLMKIRRAPLSITPH